MTSIAAWSVTIKTKPSVAKAKEGEGGDAGSRTRVQTRKQYAFYMLSQDLVFE